ncbi:MAG: site-specific tyrosine recombinase XerD [Bacteroidota bacterium]
MNWDEEIIEFKNYLRLEKSLSQNSIEGYLHDVNGLKQYLDLIKLNVSPTQVEMRHLTDFIGWINEMGLSARTQARMISGIKAFFKYLLLEEKTDFDPSSLLETPRIGRKLPVYLSIEEIDTIISVIDLSKPEGQRNKAIIETLYSCGLRVTELIELRISNLFFKDGFIKVIGKGNKERFVPIGEKAIKEINLYLKFYRNKLNVPKDFINFLFLNRRGKRITRVMIFTIIKELADIAGIKKNISPHTFRHSFATHMVEGGADLRAIQEMLGHESIITTEIYTHLDRKYLRETIIQFHPRSKKSY